MTFNCVASSDTLSIVNKLNREIVNSCIAYDVVKKYQTISGDSKMLSSSSNYNYFIENFEPEGFNLIVVPELQDLSFSYPDSGFILYACDIPLVEYANQVDSGLHLLISKSDQRILFSNKILIAYMLDSRNEICRIKYISGKFFKTEIWSDFSDISTNIVENIELFIKFKCYSLDISSCKYLKSENDFYFFELTLKDHSEKFRLVFNKSNPDVLELYNNKTLVWRNDKVFEQSIF